MTPNRYDNLGLDGISSVRDSGILNVYRLPVQKNFQVLQIIFKSEGFHIVDRGFCGDGMQ